jgi:hypothetical protein
MGANGHEAFVKSERSTGSMQRPISSGGQAENRTESRMYPLYIRWKQATI